MTYDYIIIGGGLGGLAAGAKLAKEGLKVLLLEQHDRPGGCATTFRRKEFTMEVGLHEMEALYPGDRKIAMLDDLGLTDRVRFLPLPSFYRFMNGRVDLVMPHQKEQAIQVLKHRFPVDAKGIDAFFWHLTNAKRVMVLNRNKPDRSIGDFLDEIIRDQDLKLVLLGNLGYYSDDPYELSWLYYLGAQGSHFGGRSNYIQGGSQQLSNALSEIITENGGEVKLRCLVTGTRYSGKTINGVNYRDLSDRTGTIRSAIAGGVVAANAVPSLPDMLSESDSHVLKNALRHTRNGASLLTVYFGFKKALREVGNQHYSTFIFDPSVSGPGDIGSNNRGDFSTRGFTFVDYSQVDSRLAPQGKSVGAVCAIDYPSDWEGLGKEEYLRRKSEVTDIFISRCEAFIPGFRKAVDFAEMATSLSVERYTLNPGGSVYGFAQDPDRSLEYLSSLPPKLYIASAWGKLGGGFSGAFINGYNTALDILKGADQAMARSAPSTRSQ